jgi:predicted esterase
MQTWSILAAVAILIFLALAQAAEQLSVEAVEDFGTGDASGDDDACSAEGAWCGLSLRQLRGEARVGELQADSKAELTAARGSPVEELVESSNSEQSSGFGDVYGDLGGALLGGQASRRRRRRRRSAASRSTPSKHDLVEFSYTIDNFQPSNRNSPRLTLPVHVQVLSSSEKGRFGKNGTVVFLHGAGGSAKDYNELWKSGGIDLPKGFTITFVQSPRGPFGERLKTPWLIPSGDSGKYWKDKEDVLKAQVDDDVKILKEVLRELSKEAGGYSKLWLSGRSQGASLSVLLGVAGVQQTVAGCFAIAAMALPQLQNIPSDGTYSRPTKKKLDDLRLGFYSGTKDREFTGHYPGTKSGGTFELFRSTLVALGFFAGTHKGHFWLEEGSGHSSIGPDEKNGNAFKVLFAWIGEQDPVRVRVGGVRTWV